MIEHRTKIFLLVKEHKLLTSGLLTTIAVFILLTIINNTIYGGDSAYYYELSQSLFVGRKFSITNYPASLRGIVYPTILALSNASARLLLGSKLLGWRLLISFFSGIFVISYPIIFKPLSKKNISIIPISLILLMIIWRGLFLVPMSDMVAIFLLVFTLACINKAYNAVHEVNVLKLWHFFLFVLSGILLYAAYNTRTTYMFCVPFILVFIFINRKIGIKKNFLIAFAIFIGIIATSSLQIVTNYHNLDKFSPFVQTSNYDNGRSLNLIALLKGIDTGYTENYIREAGEYDSEEDYAVRAYTYHDVAGIHLAKASNYEFFTFGDYFKSVITFPIDYMGLYMRHFFIYINPINGGAYANVSLDYPRFLPTVLNYTLLFITLIYLNRYPNLNLGKLKEISISQKMSFISVLILLLPVIVAIPGHVEDRYGLPFWIVIYGLLAYVIDMKQEFIYYKSNIVRISIYYLAGFAIIISVLTSIYAKNPLDKLLPIIQIRSTINYESEIIIEE